ncbi:7-cyano-7-deazaguanine synthase [Streptomyces sp. NPDC005474]|uniref:7-cyano-7-deazaguanine synthase n=1 Tax=Streptomyces sp. NPDC005474 TaxID=3154878 RepID=UPI0034538F51
MVDGSIGRLSNSAVVMFSGGIDSTVLLHDVARQCASPPVALHFSGFSVAHETSAARVSAGQIGAEFIGVDVKSFVHACIPTRTRPHGSDGRLVYGNSVVLSMSIAFAVARGIPCVAVGLNADDAFTVIENRPEFINQFRDCLRLSKANCRLLVPYHGWPKAKVLHRGVELGVDLGGTFSCMTPTNGIHDGTCASCLERRAAFKVADMRDPTLYAT